MEKEKCPKCGLERVEKRACANCGYISQNASAPPIKLEQYFELPFECRDSTDYNGPCPICESPVIKNKCQVCYFEGNFFAVNLINSLKSKTQG